jgi:hypothetical protein
MDFRDNFKHSWAMRCLGAIVAVTVAATCSASCDSTATPPARTPDGSASISAPRNTFPAFTADSIPTINSAADQGCVDEAGTLHAHATDWYPGNTGSALALNGEHSTSVQLNAFVTVATHAVDALAPGFVLTDQWENRPTTSGCVTHRYAVYARGDDKLVVSTWRVASAADPNWVPNEASFKAINNATMVSRGGHIATALVIAPDGTTGRVTAFGARASDLVAGWPSTFPPNPSAEAPGETPITADELVPLADEVLAQVLSQR